MERERPAAGEAQSQTRWAIAVLVDPPASEQPEMDAHRESTEAEQEVLAPAAHLAQHLALQTRDVLAAVARHRQHASTDEDLRRIAQDHDRRALGHAGSIATRDERRVKPGITAPVHRHAWRCPDAHARPAIPVA